MYITEFRTHFLSFYLLSLLQRKNELVFFQRYAIVCLNSVNDVYFLQYIGAIIFYIHIILMCTSRRLYCCLQNFMVYLHIVSGIAGKS